jgi:serine/alanine adding enzyme
MHGTLLTRAAAPPPRVAPAPDDGAGWDDFAAAAEGTFCHRWGWRGVMEEVMGHRCEYLVAREADGAWAGVLPLVHMRSRLLGRYVISIPFVNDGGPLGSPRARAALAAAAVESARAAGARLLELRSRAEAGPAVETCVRKVAVHLDLPPTVEALWAETFRAKLRSQIRRPLREGLEARVGPDEVEGFYGVFARNMRDLGTPVLPRALFHALLRAFGDDVVFATVRTPAGEAVAGGCALLWQGEMEISWASSLRAWNPVSPNMLLYARLMEEAVRRGVRVFSFGRCTPGSPTHRFKLQWGGRELPLPWGQWSPAPGASLPAADRPAFRAATALWRRLPLPIANRLGPALARRIPAF